MVEIRGRVVDSAGRPVPGAKIVLDPKMNSITGEEFAIPTEHATSDHAGRFAFTLPRAVIAALHRGNSSEEIPALAAIAPGWATAWIDLPKADDAGHELDLKLTADDVPITGKVVDDQGHPIAGVRASVFMIIEPHSRNAREFLRQARSTDREEQAKALYSFRRMLALAFYPDAPAARTDARGEFRLTGVGRDRIVLLDLDGPSIAGMQVMVITTSEPMQEPIVFNPGDEPSYRIHGPRFEVKAAPGRELAGTIRDSQTGQVIEGVRLISLHEHDESASLASSDSRGRYRLSGLPVSEDCRITIDPRNLPFFAINQDVEIPPGNGPVLRDLTLVRGVVVQGRVTHRITGRPVQARIGYFPFRTNPALQGDHPEEKSKRFRSTVQTDFDGRYRLVALPGPGLLAALVHEKGFLGAQPPDEHLLEQIADSQEFERDFKVFSKQYRRIEIPGTVKTVEAYTRMHSLQVLTQDFALDPGCPVTIQVDGPDGKPLAAGRPLHTDGSYVLERIGETPVFRCLHEEPGKKDTVLVVDRAHQLGGVITLDGHEKAPVHLTLRSTGTVTGRLVDDQGRPRVHVLLEAASLGERRSSPWLFRQEERIVTGEDGSFRITGLIPGLQYRVDVPLINLSGRGSNEGYLKATRWSLKPGEAVNWGDVRVQAARR